MLTITISNKRYILIRYICNFLTFVYNGIKFANG